MMLRDTQKNQAGTFQMNAMTASPARGSLVKYLILLLEYFALLVRIPHKQQYQGSV